MLILAGNHQERRTVVVEDRVPRRQAGSGNS
jgi:hypothetical protein